MQKTALKFGLIGGAVVVPLMTLNWFLMSGETINFATAEIFGYITMILALSTIFFGVRNFKIENGGVISFGKAFRLGLLITLVTSALYVIGWMILSNTVARDFGEQYYQYFIENLKTSDLPQEQIDAQIAGYEKSKELYKNPFIQIGVTFLEIFPIGLIVTLISALILQKKG